MNYVESPDGRCKVSWSHDMWSDETCWGESIRNTTFEFYDKRTQMKLTQTLQARIFQDKRISGEWNAYIHALPVAVMLACFNSRSDFRVYVKIREFMESYASYIIRKHFEDIEEWKKEVQEELEKDEESS